MSVFFTPKYILWKSIFVSCGSKERKYGALNVVDFTVFSYFVRYKGTLDYITNMIWCWKFFGKNNYFYSIAWMCMILIEYRSFFVKFFLVFAVFDGVNTISFSCELFTWYRFQYLFDCCWLFSSNAEDTYIDTIPHRKITVTRDIFCWVVDIGHVVMLRVLDNEANKITSWCKIYSIFKYIIFDSGVILEKGGNFCASHKFRTRWPPFSKFSVMLMNIFR